MGRQESVPTDDEIGWSEGAGETQLFHPPSPLDAGVTYLSPSQRSRSLSLAGGNLFAESLAAYFPSAPLSASFVAYYLEEREGGREGEGGRYAAASKIARASFASTSPRAHGGMDSWHVKTFAWHDGLSSLARCGHFRRRAERVIYADSGLSPNKQSFVSAAYGGVSQFCFTPDIYN